MPSTRFVLASASPRRAELLTAAGFQFDVMPVDVDEAGKPGEAPCDYVTRVAAQKAAAALSRTPDRVILAADTTVVVDGHMLGKPVDDRDAVAMLSRLSGRAHDVLTGVMVCTAVRAASDVASTRVYFASMTAWEIDWYVATGEPRDKAGAYAVQGLASRFIDRIDGSYSNVVGLPISLVYQLLRVAGK